VLKNIDKIAIDGVKEIVLTGVNLGDFGKNESARKIQESSINSPDSTLLKKETFFDLIKELDKVKSIERFRISSIEPNLLKDEIIDFVAQSKHFVPHFHIPLQSGSNKMLKAMRRRYLREIYSERVTKIKGLMPHCCIGVDVIVGFPGETDEDFLDTYNFLNELNISYLHVFTYSERDNTDAILLKGSVPVSVRKKRNKMLRILSAKKLRHFYEQHLGQTRTVLFEADKTQTFMLGFTDNYIKVKTPFNALLINQLREVTLEKIDADGTVIAELMVTDLVN
jgi:threonylcarbamoyladenosine tRNA methylthiotransferase MtaB